jgi:hypothetical protein
VNFYPEDLPAAKMLAFYAERLSTTEINYTFHRIPAAKTIDNWKQLTPEHFRFAPKAPQKITHWSKLRDCPVAFSGGRRCGGLRDLSPRERGHYCQGYGQEHFSHYFPFLSLCCYGDKSSVFRVTFLARRRACRHIGFASASEGGCF